MVKFYEYVKGENERTAKLFGIPVMKQTSDYMTAERTQEFLGGLIVTRKVSDPASNYTGKEVKLLGYPVFKRVEKDNFRTYYAFGKIIHKVSLIDLFRKEYFKYFDGKYDDIYILNANSGEIYLTLTYIISSLIKRNKSKAPLLVATKKYHADMIRMICPDIPFVYAKKLKIKLSGDVFNIDNFRIFLLFDSAHFRQVEIDIKNKPIGEIHYFKSMLNRLKISEEDVVMRKITVPADAEESMRHKIGKMGLNLNKFIFLAPEAFSCKLYDDDFWCELINRFKTKGYDVFVNLTSEDVKLKSAVDYKTCSLTFAEAFALAKYAVKIVSLRSGFTEFLLQTGVPVYVLYTKFRDRHMFNDIDISHFLSGFELTQLPFVDKSKIHEFNMFETSPGLCIDTITAE